MRRTVVTFFPFHRRLRAGCFLYGTLALWAGRHGNFRGGDSPKNLPGCHLAAPHPEKQPQGTLNLLFPILGT